MRKSRLGVVVVTLATLAAVLIFTTSCTTPFLPQASIKMASPSGNDDQAFADAFKKLKDGGTVTLGEGTYKLSKPLQIVKSVHLIGQGLDKTRIVGTAEEVVVEFNAHITATVESITFKRQGETAGDVVEVVAADATFVACGFTGGIGGGAASGNGLAFYNDSKGTVTECVAMQNQRSGVHVQDKAAVSISGSTCSQNWNAGIAFLGESTGAAEKNTCGKNGIDGIHVQDNAKPLLTKNKCSNNRKAGILYMGKAGGIASQNRCVDNVDSGISVGGDAAPEILDNFITKSPYCLAYYDHAAGVARANTCQTKGTADIGIAVFDKAHPRLIANQSSANITS
jgi:parallel beta-helix repeat protein